MQVARNDPCPCGSGRKYKHCCMLKDHATRSHPAPDMDRSMREAVAHASAWEVDALPYPTVIEGEPDGRPVLLLVAAEGLPLHSDVLSRLPGEAEAVAEALADAVRTTIQNLDMRPGRLRVRHAGVGAELEGLLQSEGIPVEMDRPLEGIDEIFGHFVEDLSSALPPLGSSIHPRRWAGWQLGEGSIRALFEAAASFWNAEPWHLLEVYEILDIVFPEGHERLGQILGSQGVEQGLGLFDSVDDIGLQFEDYDVTEWVGLLQGEVVTMLYGDRDRFPPETIREIDKAGWPVAADEAYPFLSTLAMPAGGVSEARAHDLARALSSVARLAEAVRSEEVSLAAIGPRPWTDPVTGITLSRGVVIPAEEYWADLRDVPPLPEEIHTTAPEGPGAHPQEKLGPVRDHEELESEIEGLLERFEEHLLDGGLSEQTTNTHVGNVGTLIDFMTGYQGVSHRTFRQYDLRVFLYDWYPRKVMFSRSRAGRLTVSLRRFFRFIEAEEGVSYPWTEEVLKDWPGFLDAWEADPGPFSWMTGQGSEGEEAYREMDRLVMLTDPGLGDDEEWGDLMGIDEFELVTELQDWWLRWRDDLIRQGVTDPDRLRQELVARQRAWEQAPHPGLDGQTPIACILEERAEREGRLVD